MSRHNLETQFRIHGSEDGSPYYIQVAHDWETESCEISLKISLKKQKILYLDYEEVELLIKALQGYLATRS